MEKRTPCESDQCLPTEEGGGSIFFSHATLALGDRTLFRHLDLKVGQGQLIGLSGESGCGKTSLLRAVLGFVPLTSGSVEVCGLPMDAHHVDAIRRQTAYVPQELQPLAEKGEDLIHLTHHLEHNRTAAQAERAERLAQIMKTLGLDASLLQLAVPKLSGGQRQRLLLAAALALQKPLLLLDEPSSALDEDSTQRVGLALLRACHEEGGAALIVSHDPVLLAVCDQVIDLNRYA